MGRKVRQNSVGASKSNSSCADKEPSSSGAASAPSSDNQSEQSGTTIITSLADRMSLSSLWSSSSNSGELWLVGCMFLGLWIGFVMGAGLSAVLPFGSAATPPIWKQNLANRIRATSTFQFVTFQGRLWDDWLDRFAEWAEEYERDIEAEEYANNPSHPRVFAVLREAVIREAGGYVHPDLGLMVPAPCGAARGIGMVRSSYHTCQVNCMPGTADDKYEAMRQRTDNETVEIPPRKKFRQEEVLVRVPLAFQMTRQVALDTLLPLVPADVLKRASLHELDDAALLVLLLAHERGLGRFSRWLPYIASLPTSPSCGYSEKLQPHMLDAIYAMREELGVDTQGWPDELHKATQYASKIVDGLTFDYGPYLKHPDDVSPSENINWALCQVASRATAGSDKYGALRLVPILDLVNHDANAGGFIELTGKERYHKGDFVESNAEDDTGAFVIRSMRLGQRKPLREGQELLANYNMPLYSPLDWFVSLGFVPPERWGKWHKIEPALPRVRSDGPFSNEQESTAEKWRKQGPRIIEQLQQWEL